MGVLELTAVVTIGLAPNGVSSLWTSQLEEYEARVRMARRMCGPAALCYCLRQLGKNVTVDQVLQKVAVGEEGVGLRALIDASQSLGVPAKARHSAGKRLELLFAPSILIVDSVHCVVFVGLDQDKDQITLLDPALGRSRVVGRGELLRSWKGDAIVFREMQLSRIAFLLCLVETVLSVVGLRLAMRMIIGW